MTNLRIHSKELSSLEEMSNLFENYCEDRGISLDFDKQGIYSAYTNEETASAFIWFMRAVFFVVK